MEGVGKHPTNSGIVVSSFDIVRANWTKKVTATKPQSEASIIQSKNNAQKIVKGVSSSSPASLEDVVECLVEKWQTEDVEEAH